MLIELLFLSIINLANKYSAIDNNNFFKKNNGTQYSEKKNSAIDSNKYFLKLWDTILKE